MSQSPTDEHSSASVTRYRQGWKALNRLLHEDRSFSGHERHCAFLNDGSGQFAAVSSVTGLDFPEDGRAVAVCDWDFDGDLDLWITGRTAPRVRFLCNQYDGDHHFVTVKLHGNGRSTNRDAIGARVELYFDDGGRQKLIKTVHAGDGFLSQSSLWIHFGLGAGGSIDRLIVSWPGGAREAFVGLRASGFYHIDQGTGVARSWSPPADRKPMTSSSPAHPTGGEQARIVLPFRLPLPRISALSEDDNNEEHDLALDGPVLVNVWSSTCLPCLRELAEWAEREEEIRGHGLKILALNTDRLGEDSPSPLRAREVVAQLEFPFPWRWASARTVKNLDSFQRAVLDRWRPLPVPCSFLADRHGQVVVIYKGVAGIDQLLSDMELLDASPEELRRAAIPFGGRWMHDVPTPEPLQVARQLIDRAEVVEGIRYLKHYAETALKTLDGSEPSVHLGDIYYVLGVLLDEHRQKEDALAAWQEARRLNPDDVRVRSDLGRLLGQLGRFREAGDELARAVQINPDKLDDRRRLGMALLKQRRFQEAIKPLRIVIDQRPSDALAHFELANALGSVAQWHLAIEHYREALRHQPRMLLAANNLAWILATHPDVKLRNGEEAVRLAEQICRETGFRQPSMLDTLAVAYAETGRFDSAVDAASKGIRLMQQSGSSEDQIQPVRKRLQLFQQHECYREDQ